MDLLGLLFLTIMISEGCFPFQFGSQFSTNVLCLQVILGEENSLCGHHMDHPRQAALLCNRREVLQTD